MSKIICDICGTTYPETATQCPICGFVRPADARTITSNDRNASQKKAGTYTYVKGGRFSKANVRKRSQTPPPRREQSSAQRTAQRSPGTRQGKSDRGLVAAVIVLLLAIIAVVLYIAVRFFLPDLLPLTKPENTTAPTENSTLQTPPPEIACTGLTLSKTDITLKQPGGAELLSVVVQPADTTDILEFESSDPAVAIVTPSGKITANAPGQVTITVRCGSIVKECTVICDFEAEIDPTETQPPETTEAPTEPPAEFSLNRTDFTLFSVGEAWNVYSGPLKPSEITWSSDNTAVATIENGKVVAVGSGVTTVHGEYNGVKCDCIVRCNFENPGVPGNGSVSPA